MTTGLSGLAALRLDLAGARGFDAPGAGPARRRGMGELTREWLVSTWDEAMAGKPQEGIALAAVGSLARGDSGPLSDLDLVLLHNGRSLGGDDLGEVADRL